MSFPQIARVEVACLPSYFFDVGNRLLNFLTDSPKNFHPSGRKFSYLRVHKFNVAHSRIYLAPRSLSSISLGRHSVIVGFKGRGQRREGENTFYFKLLRAGLATFSSETYKIHVCSDAFSCKHVHVCIEFAVLFQDFFLWRTLLLYRKFPDRKIVYIYPIYIENFSIYFCNIL